MDEVGHDYDPPPVPVRHEQSVAVVGSGPAGLTAAQDLSVAGYKVHVYEMTDRFGRHDDLGHSGLPAAARDHPGGYRPA